MLSIASKLMYPLSYSARQVDHLEMLRDCFFTLLLYRFRKALEPHISHTPDGPRRKALKPSGDLLLGISGGLGSTVLLDVVHRTYLARGEAGETAKGGRDHPKKDRIWKKIRAAYIEVAGAFPQVRTAQHKLCSFHHRVTTGTK